MSIDLIITLAIGAVAALYIGLTMRRSARKLLGTSRGTGSACGSCSGCGTSEGHADSEDSCSVKNAPLVVLGEKSHSKSIARTP
jgi:hypothetical protein